MTEMQLVQVVAGCVLARDDKYLLVQEKRPKVYGLWNLPAGHVDKGESIEVAAIREAREETGYKVALDRKLPVEHIDLERPVLHAFKAHIISGSLKAQPEELLDARWFSLEDVKRLHQEGKLRNDWVLNSILESLR
jgi:8-oxo-dGTP diphosphatase